LNAGLAFGIALLLIVGGIVLKSQVRGQPALLEPTHSPLPAVPNEIVDLDDPSQVRGLMRTPLLAPEAPYEIDGFRGSVIFPCGLIYDEGSGEVRLYYGAADTSVALATGHVDELIAACEPLL